MKLMHTGPGSTAASKPMRRGGTMIEFRIGLRTRRRAFSGLDRRRHRPGLRHVLVRRGHRGGPPRSHTHWDVEGDSLMSGVMLFAIGFMLLKGAFQNTGGRILAIIGTTAYLFGAVLLVTAEALS